MKISVVVPTYNSEATVAATLDSALLQTTPAEEILVIDDGSTDGTVQLLRKYGTKIRLFEERHQGLAAMRNLLFDRARGELIAFLDSDDLWHPRYLEVQRQLAVKYSDACAFFTGHVNFLGSGTHEWDVSADNQPERVEVMDPAMFLRRYHRETGPFASPSYCCIPKSVLAGFGTKPFAAAVEDLYAFSMMCLSRRPIVYMPTPLAAYRITEKALSADLLKMLRLSVDAFQTLDKPFQERATPELYSTFKHAFASKRREYAKVLMGVSNKAEARRQLRSSLKEDLRASSVTRSLALLFATYMPPALQPEWPSSIRKWKPAEQAPPGSENGQSGATAAPNKS